MHTSSYWKWRVACFIKIFLIFLSNKNERCLKLICFIDTLTFKITQNEQLDKLITCLFEYTLLHRRFLSYSILPNILSSVAATFSHTHFDICFRDREKKRESYILSNNLLYSFCSLNSDIMPPSHDSEI